MGAMERAGPRLVLQLREAVRGQRIGLAAHVGAHGAPRPECLAGSPDADLLAHGVQVKTIRAASPAATVVGPTFACENMPTGAGWDLFCDPGGNTTMARFLPFARARGVLPDILAWHKWGPRGDEVRGHVAPRSRTRASTSHFRFSAP